MSGIVVGGSPIGAAAGTVAPGLSMPTFRILRDRGGLLPAGTTVATYVMLPDAAPLGVASGASGRSIFYLDPAELAITGFSTMLRISSAMVLNATNPAATFTFGLYPVTATAGTTGNVTVTIDTVVSGSQPAAFASPTTNSRQVSAAFAHPAAGFYALGVDVSVATTAANSTQLVRSVLSAHYA